MGIFGFGRGKTLYYPGCLTKGVLKEQFENYKEIFNRLGINFVLLDDAVCCGLPVLNAGYRKDAKKLAERNFDIFRKAGIRKIVTNCPSCYHAFKEVYPKLVRDFGRSATYPNGGWGNIEVEHATVAILNALKKKRIKFRGVDEDRELVAYHDPCYLGRRSGIYEEPREVIELLGGKIMEMKNNRENAICCGGKVSANFSELAKDVAKLKVREVSGDVTKIISPCGSCYSNITSGVSARVGSSESGVESEDKLKSVEFSSFVLGKLRGLR